MAFTTNTKVTWQDLVDLYSNLNTGRSKFGFGTVTLTDNKLAGASQVSTVNALVNEMSSNKYLTSVAKTNITVPTIASLLQASFTFQIANTVNNINSTCAHDAANFTTNRSHFTTNRSFDGFFTSNRSFDGFFTSDKSFKGNCTNQSNQGNFVEGRDVDFPSREANSSF